MLGATDRAVGPVRRFAACFGDARAPMCEALGVSRSGYYARASRPESVQAAADRSLAAEIRIAHKNSRSRLR